MVLNVGGKGETWEDVGEKLNADDKDLFEI